jgi:hypothetical protein
MPLQLQNSTTYAWNLSNSNQHPYIGQDTVSLAGNTTCYTEYPDVIHDSKPEIWILTPENHALDSLRKRRPGLVDECFSQTCRGDP